MRFRAVTYHTMKEGQLKLIPSTYNPLVERIGPDFFEELPREPGVYRMMGPEGSLLYVGKAKDLRNRLLTYRRARTGKVSRKTVRLLREVHRINYEVCDSEEAALLRENALIREERPPFNRAKKQPETYYFIHLRREPGALHFRLDMKQAGGEGWRSYGAFKGHRFTRRAMGALLRQCYFRVRGIGKACELPPVLTRNLTPLNFRLTLPEEGDDAGLYRLLENYLAGREDGFSEWPDGGRQTAGTGGNFTRSLLLADAEVLGGFFERRSRFNRDMAERLGLDSHLIPQSELDDAITRSRFR